MSSASMKFILLTIAMLLILQLTLAQLRQPVSLPLVSFKTRNSGSSCLSSAKPDNIQTIRALVNDILTKIVPHCGDGLWHQVAHLNMRDPTQTCPSAWTEYRSNGVRACTRQNSTMGSCSGTRYSTGRLYSKVCGRVIGYQFGRPDAFSTYNGQNRNVPINSSYVDGVSITTGTPRRHIWTYASGFTEQSKQSWSSLYTCPCAGNYSGPGTPSFVGNAYYCESANKNESEAHVIYPDDKLWDGEQCATEGTCCTHVGHSSPPWFSVELLSPTRDEIEVRICADEDTAMEATPVELIDIYVQ